MFFVNIQKYFCTLQVGKNGSKSLENALKLWHDADPTERFHNLGLRQGTNDTTQLSRKY